MDPSHTAWHLWLHHYGSAALFFFVAAGIFAIPIPVEMLLITAGAFMSHGEFGVPQTLIGAYAGSVCGITGSYLVGRTAGHALLMKYGEWVGLEKEHWDTTEAWFERSGKWLLFTGYFIPVVRHLTGILAGSTSSHFREFALFAYSGALVWTVSYLSAGYLFGHYAIAFHAQFLRHIELTLAFVSLAGLALFLLYRLYKNRT